MSTFDPDKLLPVAIIGGIQLSSFTEWLGSVGFVFGALCLAVANANRNHNNTSCSSSRMLIIGIRFNHSLFFHFQRANNETNHFAWFNAILSLGAVCLKVELDSEETLTKFPGAHFVVSEKFNNLSYEVIVLASVVLWDTKLARVFQLPNPWLAACSLIGALKTAQAYWLCFTLKSLILHLAVFNV